MSLELFDQPPGIINADVKLTVSGAKKCPGKLAQLAGGFAGQNRQLGAAASVNQTILEIDPDLRVGTLEKFLDLTKERFVHKTSDGRASSSR